MSLMSVCDKDCFSCVWTVVEYLLIWVFDLHEHPQALSGRQVLLLLLVIQLGSVVSCTHTHTHTHTHTRSETEGTWGCC